MSNVCLYTSLNIHISSISMSKKIGLFVLKQKFFFQ